MNMCLYGESVTISDGYDMLIPDSRFKDGRLTGPIEPVELTVRVPEGALKELEQALNQFAHKRAMICERRHRWSKSLLGVVR